MHSDIGSRKGSKERNEERGFIGLMIVLIVSLVLLKYITGLSVVALVGQGIKTLHTVWDHVHPPLLSLWGKVTHIYDWATSTTAFKDSNQSNLSN